MVKLYSTADSYYYLFCSFLNAKPNSWLSHASFRSHFITAVYMKMYYEKYKM